MKKIIVLLLCLLMLAPACLFAPSVKAEEITDWVEYELQSEEMTTFNIFHTHSAVDFNILTNGIDALLTHNNYGQLLPNIADKWETPDNGKTWNFHIRDGVTWVDMNGEFKADVVAEDWVWGLEWVLNFHKNDSYNTSMPVEMIKGAKEYYEYTKGLDAEEAKALKLDKFLEIVGIEAVDKNTLKYTLNSEYPYFATLATYACLYPVSGKLLEEIGVEGFRAATNENIWYSGPYLVTSFIHQNEKVLSKNPSYWNKEAKVFDTITIKMVESDEMAFQLLQTGENNRCFLTEANLQTIWKNKDNEFHDYLVENRPSVTSMQIHFNFDKLNEDGSKDENWNKAIGNLAFRQCWLYGIDMTPALSRINAINPLGSANYTYSSPNLVYDDNSVDYRDLVLERLNIKPDPEKFVRYDAEKAAALKKQAMEELSAEGVTFPVKAVLYVKSGDQTEFDTATIWKQLIKDSLGDDFVVMEIKEFVSSRNEEVIQPQLFGFCFNGWSPDYGDPISNVAQETIGEDNAFYSVEYSNINNVDKDTELVKEYEEYTRMVREAAAINDDMNARYHKFADAEAYLVEHAFTIPYYVSVAWMITNFNVYSKIYSPYGIQVNRRVNWETSTDLYTTEEYETFKEAFEAGKPGK